MIFFLGIYHPSTAAAVPAAMISANVLRDRRSGFPVRRWLMDSGAFSEVTRFGAYRLPPEEYAAVIRRFARNGKLLGAVAQDFMCEPFVLERTGGSVALHQTWTIDRYDALLTCDTGGVYVMPVLQGYAPGDYAAHVRAYGSRLGHRAWVGVGSVCKRNAKPAAIEAVLLAIRSVRPDLRLHGFGVKVSALGNALVRQLLFSADSMAWSFAARYEGRDSNSIEEAKRYGRRVATMPQQLPLGLW